MPTQEEWAEIDRKIEALNRFVARKTALAAAAREGGDVQQAPGEAPQSGGCKPQRPNSVTPSESPHVPR